MFQQKPLSVTSELPSEVIFPLTKADTEVIDVAGFVTIVGRISEFSLSLRMQRTEWPHHIVPYPPVAIFLKSFLRYITMLENSVFSEILQKTAWLPYPNMYATRPPAGSAEKPVALFKFRLLPILQFTFELCQSVVDANALAI